MKLFRRKKKRTYTLLELLFLGCFILQFRKEIDKVIQEMIERGEIKVKK